MRDSAPLPNSQDPRHGRRPRRVTARRCIGATIPLIALATTLHPVSGIEHTIEPGEALWTIAGTYGVTVDELVAANELGDPDMIFAGRTLTVPDADADSNADTIVDTDATAASHAVASGDTLWAIADRYDVPLGALARQNAIGGDALIFPGQVLELPRADDETDATVEASTPEQSEAQTQSVQVTHTVEAGDSLWGIASTYNVVIDDLLGANDMTRDDVLLPGQQLVVTPSPPSLTDLPADLVDDPERLAMLPVFDRWATEYGIPADLLKALAWFESGWNNTKISSADAIGIGQLLPITADFVGDILLGGAVLDPHVPEQNIQLSARYLRYLLDHAGSVRLAIASYYQGLTATRQHGIYRSSEFYVDGILALRERFD